MAEKPRDVTVWPFCRHPWFALLKHRTDADDIFLSQHGLFDFYPSSYPADTLLRIRGAVFANMNAAKLARRHLKVPRSAITQQVRARSTRAASTCSIPNYAEPSFPCVDAHAARESRILASSFKAATAPTNGTSASSSGPEPPYARPSPSSYKTFHSEDPLPLS